MERKSLTGIILEEFSISSNRSSKWNEEVYLQLREILEQKDINLKLVIMVDEDKPVDRKCPKCYGPMISGRVKETEEKIIIGAKCRDCGWEYFPPEGCMEVSE